jgi:ankyrin repeat protein
MIPSSGRADLNAREAAELIPEIIDAIAAGADIDECHSEGAGMTPLMKTFWNDGCDAIADVLLDNGADVTIINRDNRTALHYACMENRPEIVKRLLAMGADPNDTTPDGSTILGPRARSGSGVCLLRNRAAMVSRRTG